MKHHQSISPSLPLPLPAANLSPTWRNQGGLQLADAAVESFNSQLHDVHRQAPSVATDQILQLVEWLQKLPTEIAAATIRQRLAQAESLRRMIDDPDWSLPTEVSERGRKLLDYIRRIDDLIPDDVPLIGHLDDALLVELSWSEFAGELQDYLDYCRFCSEDAVRGSGTERRTAWESNCLAEASAMLHRQEVRQRGYARPAPLSRPFRVC